MNLRQLDREIAVTSWENIAATSRPIPDLTGYACTVGIDYSMLNDWCGINAHFKIGDKRYDINHAFICTQGPHFVKLKCPVDEWRDAGLVTYVDTPDIRPDVIEECLLKIMQKHFIQCIAMDSFRFTILAPMLEKLGFTLKDKNIKITRPSDQMRIAPLVDSIFNNQLFYWGDNPVLRWSANNTSLVPYKKSTQTTEEVNFGNFVYGKIEPVRRKTDPFMALVFSVMVEDTLPEYQDTTQKTAFRRVKAVAY